MVSTVEQGHCAASQTDRIQQAIEHATHYLPSQGPIKVFVHHNTLHAFEDLKFDQGVLKGLEKYGCEPYFSEARYRQEMAKGRIRQEDLESVLIDDLGDEADRLVASFGTRYGLRLAMLCSPIQQLPSRELDWLLSETQVLEEGPSSGDLAKSRRALWDACVYGVSSVPRGWNQASPKVHNGPRDRLIESVGYDTDRWVHEWLIRYCSAFLDQGFAPFTLVDRDRGFLETFLELYRPRWQLLPSWLKRLPEYLGRVKTESRDRLELIVELLQRLGIDEEEWDVFIEQSLLALRGWAGMIWQMESQTPWTPYPMPKGTLIEFLLVRLLLDVQAVEYAQRHQKQVHGRKSTSENPLVEGAFEGALTVKSLAYALFLVALQRKWNASELKSLTPAQWEQLVKEFHAFDGLARRRIFQLAYERRYRVQALDAVACSVARRREQGRRETPWFQAIACIDDREESFRRHLEEVEPRCQTFGAAGFYAVVMYYRGASEAHYRPLCPINAVPQHYVQEEPLFSSIDLNERRQQRRRQLGAWGHFLHASSRTMLGGLLTGLLGSLATFPLVARVLSPRLASRIRGGFGSLVRPPSTELHLERTGTSPGMSDEGLGYSIDEMAKIVIRILQDIGLTDGFSRLIVFFGHGSSSLNNPHESAYNCGACSGGRGGPNARAFAKMANDPRVRHKVAQAGIDVPEEVRFLGAYHNTCNDRVEYYDLDQLPNSHRVLFRSMEASVHEARCRNAQERSRRFESASLGLTPAEALEHVEERSEDLSQARPEYNHATNAMCFVGQRHWTRGLFMDRRSFLASYDPNQDDERGAIVERVLQAAIPVCGGISLEYYFSTVDPEGYGCGSKLPHNITSLAGVMTGAASDLRPGLSQQMVEIHEPLRILFVIETTANIMRRIIDANPPIHSLVENEWVQIALLDPETQRLSLYRRGVFEPYKPIQGTLPEVPSSKEWYHAQRDHLGFALTKASQEVQHG